MATRTLILGYGNPGRQDDGLGQAAAEAIARLQLPGVRIITSFSLNIEHAADAAEHDAIVFIDAASTGPEPFTISDVTPCDHFEFTSHLVTPAAILALSKRLYGRLPAACMIAIGGYEFDIGDGLTTRASANLEQAVAYLRVRLTSANYFDG